VVGVRHEILQADQPVGDTSRQIHDAVSGSERPLLLLQAPAERIVAASPAAQKLLAPAGIEDLIGRLLSDLTVATASEAPMLLASRRLNGYQTHRAVRDAGSEQLLSIWLRALDDHSDPQLVLAVLSRAGAEWAGELTDSISSTVIGATDESLTLDRISDNVESFLGVPPEDVLGQSLLRLVAAEDLADLLFALARATSAQEGVGLQLRMLGRARRELRCQLMILPLLPRPSCAFALQPAHDFAGRAFSSSEDVQILLGRLGEGIQAAGAARDLSERRSQRDRPLAELTARESQIVSRLLAGDRVPAIARQLFLAQSTVRNHLSAVFAKLGVRSQQELIVLMRQSLSGSEAQS
jgi:DNA-binding CsgD family transcriptional regulator